SALVLARKSITMPTACPRALKGSGAVRTALPATIPNDPCPTFQILLCGTSAAVVIAAHPASRSKTANTFQLGAKDSVGIQMRGVNKWLSMQPASVQFLP